MRVRELVRVPVRVPVPAHRQSRENPHHGRRGVALNHSPSAGESGRQGERIAWGEDMPLPHLQLGTVGFIYLFYSEIYQTWD